MISFFEEKNNFLKKLKKLIVTKLSKNSLFLVNVIKSYIKLIKTILAFVLLKYSKLISFIIVLIFPTNKSVSAKFKISLKNYSKNY